MPPVHESDPIHAVLRELTINGEPSLAWVIQQTAERGEDPVRQAWLASRDPDAMLFLLMTLEHPKWMEALPVRDRAGGQQDPAIADELRALVGAPLTLDYVMEHMRVRATR
jgi:hypothetical protein